MRVEFHDSTDEVPDSTLKYLDDGMAEGVAWKFAPFRLFPERHKLSLDDDCILSSPFPPHRPDLGRCGAHFAGLNAKSLPWSLEGRPAIGYIREFRRRRRPLVEERVDTYILKGSS